MSSRAAPVVNGSRAVGRSGADRATGAQLALTTGGGGCRPREAGATLTALTVPSVRRRLGTGPMAPERSVGRASAPPPRGGPQTLAEGRPLNAEACPSIGGPCGEQCELGRPVSRPPLRHAGVRRDLKVACAERLGGRQQEPARHTDVGAGERFAGLTSRRCSFGLRLADADGPTGVTPAGRTPRDLGLTVDRSVRTVTLGCATGAAAWSYGGSDVLGRRSVSSAPLKIDKEAENCVPGTRRLQHDG
jgi:hypothetical protein